MAETKPKYKLKDAYHRAMIKATKDREEGIIKGGKQYKERLKEHYMVCLAEDVAKVRSETKQALYRGLVLSATISILVSWFVSSVFLGLKEFLTVKVIVIYIIISGIVVFGVILKLLKKLGDLETGKKI